MTFYKVAAILLGIAASLLIALGILVFEGFMPVSLTDNLTATELAALGTLAAVGAVGAYFLDREA